MAIKILEDCINCSSCIDSCPVEAIVDENENPFNDFHYIYPDQCNECISFNESPECAIGCPVDAIRFDLPFTKEYKQFFLNNNYIFKNREFQEQVFIEEIKIEKRKNNFSAKKK